MFNLFKKKQTSADVKNEIRNMLLGDVPIPAWGKETTDGIPWSLFAEARELIVKKQNYPAAIELYQKITETPGLESRHYLQAWHFLRRLKVNPRPRAIPKSTASLWMSILKTGLNLSRPMQITPPATSTTPEAGSSGKRPIHP